MMMLSEASAAMQGRLYGGDELFDSVEIDTRRLDKRALYFAIHGESQNGHAYIAEAMQEGASAAVSDEPFTRVEETRHIEVDDTTLALGMLAGHWRERFNVPVVGITGSNGKTTVCAIVRQIFAESIPGIAPQGSFNNHWGVPLTLLKLRSQHQSAIIEMGMNHAGEISYLSSIVKPTIGLITNAAAAHLEGLKTIQGVATAKGELIDAVDKGGTIVLNRDDQFYDQWKAQGAGRRQLSFGIHPMADIRVQAGKAKQLVLQIEQHSVKFEWSLLGEHNRLNAAASVAVALAAGIPMEAISRGLRQVEAVNGRLKQSNPLAELLLIDDSYNANRASMQAAIDVLSEQAGHKILVLGGMGELGKDSSRIHAEVGEYAKKQGIDNMLTLVDQTEADYLNNMAGYLKGFGANSKSYSDVDSLVARLKAMPRPVSILVKGSRFTVMERVVEAIKKSGALTC